ncbi:MAG: class I SAM-dependent methyltransferase [Acidobacteriota bacterium]
MAKAQWGAEPEFFGPRHAHREGRILRALDGLDFPAGPHLECAAGVGSLSAALAARGRVVVAGDLSLRSLAVIRRKMPPEAAVFSVVCDITSLPFPDASFSTATSAETLEHIPNDTAAATELGRTLAPGGALVGSVPAGPEQFSDWDVWADHQRRYTKDAMETLLEGAGLQPTVTVWGWPILRLYDDFFLKRVNRRRLQSPSIEGDASLRRVSSLGRKKFLVKIVQAAFSIDRLFDNVRWGVGLLFVGRKA